MGWRDPGSVPEGSTAERVIICGDPEASAPVRALLGDAGFDIVFVDTGRDSLAEALVQRPALVVVDMDGRDAMGFVVCSMLRDRHGELLPIVLVSGERTSTSDRVAGLLLGADDYLVKPFEPTEVVARVRRLVKRSTAAAATEAMLGNGDAVEDFELTPREQEVLSLLVGGFSQVDIANKLVISTNTVAAHIQRILHKMGVRSRAQAVAKAMRAGWATRSDGAGSITQALDGALRSAAPRRPHE